VTTACSARPAEGSFARPIVSANREHRRRWGSFNRHLASLSGSEREKVKALGLELVQVPHHDSDHAPERRTPVRRAATATGAWTGAGHSGDERRP
jgi:hypothetical protein